MSEYANLLIDLAVEESAAGRFASAAALLRSILGASGRDAFVLYGLGHMEYRQHKFGEAVRLLRQSLAMEPTNAKAQCDLGLALFKLGEQQAAYDALMRGWTLDEELALAVMSEGIENLRAGDFGDGWLKYEARLIARPGVRPRRAFPQRRWLGRENIAGKTILLHSEQGFGDAIQFVRYVPRVAALGATVLLEGHAALMPVFRDIAGVSATFELNEALPPFDVQCPLMSLPLAFRTDLASIPGEVPYLVARTAHVNEWRRRLGERSGLRVGIAWSGNAANEADRERAIALETLTPLFAVPGCEFQLIQTDIRAADRQVLEQLPDLRDQSTTLSDSGDFTNTAALIAELDLVISVDTSVAHLAGALGKPVWLLLPSDPDWRWLLGRNDSPWYPTMRLFRQALPGDWRGVIAAVTAMLGVAVSSEEGASFLSGPVR
jgi:hypothetical protein